jgi:hypothetical protein
VHTSEELAAALVLTGRAADMLLDLAAGLARLPGVSAALASGAIDRARAVVFVDELAALTGADANDIAATVLPRAADLTTGQLRAALRRAVLAFDPAAARRRRERAAAEARVETWDEASGNCALSGRELSPADAVAADRHTNFLAQRLKAAGAPGTVGQLQAAVFAALLSGRSPESLLPMPSPGEPGQEPGGRGQAPGGMTPVSGHGLAWPAGPRGTVHLTMPFTTWLGLSDAPGTIGTVGPADGAICRDLATDLAGRAGTRWCLTITGPEGRALGHACAAAGPPGRPPPGPAPPGGSPPGPAPPGAVPPGTAEWLAGLAIQWLETGLCSHRRATINYRPSARLHHLVKVRNPTCSFPGCRWPARRCDDDHTIPYEQGGMTCECNLAPLCRRHHRVKQAAGWHLEQPQPGVLIWTLPHGRRYVTTAEPYPA